MQGGFGGTTGFGQTSGLRPGSSLRPGSQMRPGSQLRGTQVAGVGGSLQQPVAIAAKAPVTLEGMRAATRSGNAGPGRQVGDRSYYIGLLRPKITELTTEIQQLNEQESLIEKNSSVLTQLHQRGKNLTEEITKLKGTLADINLAVEKSTSQDANSVKDQATKLTHLNVDRRKQVDQMFLNVKEVETQTKKNLQILEEEMQQLDRRIMAENQDYNLYNTTRNEAYAVSDAVLNLQHRVRTLTAKQELHMAQLATDTDKRRAAEVLREILRKRQLREELTKQCALSVDEERQLLIKQVKTARNDIEVLERQVNETRDALGESKSRCNALDEELKSYSGENLKAFQELQEKDRELQSFMDSLPERQREESEKIATVQSNISLLLERISRALELQKQMPAEGASHALQALESEVDARRNQIESDQVTHQRLERELLDRKVELEKVENLDIKINAELQAHARKMEEQSQEMIRYSDLDGLRRNVEKRHEDLVRERAFLVKLRDSSKHQLNALSASNEALRKRLNEEAAFRSVSTLEGRLRHLRQSNFSLEEFVRLKGKESYYLGAKTDCLRLVDEINLLLKDTDRTRGIGGGPVLLLGEH
ncbi:putative Intraflagellar transport protein 74 [Trypanosoma cruzi]|nr:putative Intraflagellar transport protein 74 [Trypanosoma cruzi]